MQQRSWMTWVLLVCLLWICPIDTYNNNENNQNEYSISERLRRCLLKSERNIIVPDNFNGFINAPNCLRVHNQTKSCIIFLQKNGNKQPSKRNVRWPKMDKNGTQLYISMWHIKKKLDLYVLYGENCNAMACKLTGSTKPSCVFNHTVDGSCQVRCLHTETMCESSAYDENCPGRDPQVKNKYIVNITEKEKNCRNCDNPVKQPETTITTDVQIQVEEGEKLDPVQAVKVINQVADLVASMNDSSASLSVGDGVTGILVREPQPEDVDEVSFAYLSPNESINIIESRDDLGLFPRSVTVSKEAFEKAVRLNVSVPYAALFRFTNLASDELNSTVLGDEVLAVEMGAAVSNLTDKISINFQKMKYKGIPTCQSWDGEGSRPNWTRYGCETLQDGDNITCQCSHLTFFAILLTPLNETIPSSDLNTLTIITQVGCGLSMFFLAIVLFTHFLLRRTKASMSTMILIHLVSAMFLLNLTFLINNYVAKIKNSVGCKIIAALMHYFMLATFTWFAAQAFHLCLQLHTGGKILIHRYILKVSIISWVLPSLVGIVLLSVGKYGEQIIHTDNTENNVAMCWITDNNIHFIVNIGYYVLVFLFTFTTFIIILSWLFCLRRTKGAEVKMSSNSKNILTILGLCCMLGITWGFAFFAYGVLRIPSYYIFTVLNSFQGFFLFIYYYNTSHSEETNNGMSTNSNSTTTLKTSLGSYDNPYNNQPGKKIKP